MEIPVLKNKNLFERHFDACLHSIDVPTELGRIIPIGSVLYGFGLVPLAA